jgi:hypothetical protein
MVVAAAGGERMTGTRAPARAELARGTVRVLSRGGAGNADVLLVRDGQDLAVVKDFAARGRWVRAWLAPWLVRRELRAYRVLAGHPAVPVLLGRVDRLAFAVEYRPGKIMSASLVEDVSEGFVDELYEAVRLMHERGVAHLDLRHRSNMLAGEDGHPVLVDFASSVCFKRGGWAARRLLPWLAEIDRGAVRKWERRLRTRASDRASG